MTTWHAAQWVVQALHGSTTHSHWSVGDPGTTRQHNTLTLVSGWSRHYIAAQHTHTGQWVVQALHGSTTHSHRSVGDPGTTRQHDTLTQVSGWSRHYMAAQHIHTGQWVVQSLHGSTTHNINNANTERRLRHQCHLVSRSE